MHRRRPNPGRMAWASLCVVASMTAAACSADSAVPEAASPSPTPVRQVLDVPELGVDADPEIARFEDFAAAEFSEPTVVDNPYLPLTPGNRIVLSGTTVEDGEAMDHQIRYVVTGLSKEIAGVDTVVVWIEDYSDNELVEVEIAFYAQDDVGNVWFFGEHPEEFEEHTRIDAPTWIAGVDGAYPGIAMYADPASVTSPYFQGWGPGVEWSDFAVVETVGEEICIEIGCYADSIVIAESSLDEAGIAQLKSYAPGVGNIAVGFRGDDETQEELEVVDHSRLSERELATFNVLAKTFGANAYVVNPDVYGSTSPIG